MINIMSDEDVDGEYKLYLNAREKQMNAIINDVTRRSKNGTIYEFLKEILTGFGYCDRMYQWSDEQRQWILCNGYYSIAVKRINQKVKELRPDTPDELFKLAKVGEEWDKRRFPIGSFWLHGRSYYNWQKDNNVIQIQCSSSKFLALKTTMYDIEKKTIIPRTMENSPVNFLKLDLTIDEFKLSNVATTFLADLFDGNHQYFLNQLHCLISSDLSFKNILIVNPPPVLTTIFKLILGDLIHIHSLDEGYLFSNHSSDQTVLTTHINPHAELILIVGPYKGGQPVSKRIVDVSRGCYYYNTRTVINRISIPFWLATEEEYVNMFADLGKSYNANMMRRHVRFLHCKKGDYDLVSSDIIDIAKGLIALIIQYKPTNASIPICKLHDRIFGFTSIN